MSELTDNEWQIVYDIAEQICNDGGNVGELKKVMTYLRTCVDAPDGGAKFFRYLGYLVSGGDRIGHSKRTVDYYRKLNDVCIEYLQPLQDSPQMMLEILGWAGRLIPYYQFTPCTDQKKTSQEIKTESAKQTAIKTAAAEANLAVGQVVSVVIAAVKIKDKGKKKGKEVSLDFGNGIKMNHDEYKKSDQLFANQSIRVEIIELRRTNVPKKIKIVDP